MDCQQCLQPAVGSGTAVPLLPPTASLRGLLQLLEEKGFGESVQSSLMPVHPAQVGSSQGRLLSYSRTVFFHYLQMPSFRASESRLLPPDGSIKRVRLTLVKAYF